MARGDFVDVTYRTGAGTEVKRVQARQVGGTVHTEMPGRDGKFITVEEINKANATVRTTRFAASEVVAIDEGHAEVVIVDKVKGK